MNFPILIASGDPALFMVLAGMLIAVGAVLALGITGGILLLAKDATKRQLGKRLLLAMVVLLAAAAGVWIAFAGMD
jgi:hypothetical protein